MGVPLLLAFPDPILAILTREAGAGAAAATAAGTGMVLYGYVYCKLVEWLNASPNRLA